MVFFAFFFFAFFCTQLFQPNCKDLLFWHFLSSTALWYEDTNWKKSKEKCGRVKSEDCLCFMLSNQRNWGADMSRTEKTEIYSETYQMKHTFLLCSWTFSHWNISFGFFHWLWFSPIKDQSKKIWRINFLYVKEFWIKFRVAVKSIVVQCLLLTWSQGILYTEYINFFLGGEGIKIDYIHLAVPM